MATSIELGDRGTGGGQRAGAVGAGCGLLFGFLFFGFGLVITVFMGRTFLDQLVTYRWDQVPCELLDSEVGIDREDKDSPFELRVEYRYNYGEETYRSTQYRLDGFSVGGDDYRKLERQRRSLLADEDLVCWVDPEAPDNAVLSRDSLFVFLVLLIPLAFVGIGLVIMVGSIKARKVAKSGGQRGGGMSGRAVGAVPALGRAIGFIVFGVFFLVGAGLMYPLLIKPVLTARAAQNWPEVGCQVIWSRVQSHSSSDGTTYSIDIFYEYEVNGETYRSNRYGYLGGSSSGHSGKADVVRQYPEGSTQICYVDPEDSLYAVLNRDLGAWAFFGLLPTAFFLIGGGGLFAMLRSKKGKRERDRRVKWGGAARGADRESVRSGRITGFSQEGVDSNQTKELRPGSRRLGGFFLILFIAAFWNGIVSVFLFEVIDGFRRGNPSWFDTVLLTPFVLVGSVLILGVGYTLLALFNPKPVIRLRPGSLKLGADAEIEWTISGGASRIASLEILIEASECATYRRGTDTRTDREVFYRRVIARADRLETFYRGSGRFALPSDLPASVDTGNNRIEWKLKVFGSIRFWPDIADAYPLDVRPVGKTAS